MAASLIVDSPQRGLSPPPSWPCALPGRARLAGNSQTAPRRRATESEMERHFERELEDLNKQLLLMGGRAETIVLKSVEALRRLDRDLANEVFADDKIIDRMELDIDERCLRLLALQQPMAKDLRLITAALKTNNDLKPVGDHAVNIAGSVMRLAGKPLLKPLIDIPRMAELASDMLHEALDAFVRRDAETARRICLRDDAVDALNDQIFRELVSYMVEDPMTITRAME